MRIGPVGPGSGAAVARDRAAVAGVKLDFLLINPISQKGKKTRLDKKKRADGYE